MIVRSAGPRSELSPQEADEVDLLADRGILVVE
jgi:hypothetical protein